MVCIFTAQLMQQCGELLTDAQLFHRHRIKGNARRALLDAKAGTHQLYGQIQLCIQSCRMGIHPLCQLFLRMSAQMREMLFFVAKHFYHSIHH